MANPDSSGRETARLEIVAAAAILCIIAIVLYIVFVYRP